MRCGFGHGGRSRSAENPPVTNPGLISLYLSALGEPLLLLLLLLPLIESRASEMLVVRNLTVTLPPPDGVSATTRKRSSRALADPDVSEPRLRSVSLSALRATYTHVRSISPPVNVSLRRWLTSLRVTIDNDVVGGLARYPRRFLAAFRRKRRAKRFRWKCSPKERRGRRGSAP